jgi:hypothetical protein
LGASREVYALALETDMPGITERWDRAQEFPIPPVLAASGPCKDLIKLGARLTSTTCPSQHGPSSTILARS